MEPRERTHLVNELMQEAMLMQTVLEKAMEGQQEEARHPALHGTHHPQGTHLLQEEHDVWARIAKALKDIQTDLDRVEQYEQERITR